MAYDDFKRLYEEMLSLLSKDPELTQIDVSFEIRPVTTQKKIARINVKTFKDENRTNKKY
jgi:hypothetical protein